MKNFTAKFEINQEVFVMHSNEMKRGRVVKITAVTYDGINIIPSYLVVNNLMSSNFNSCDVFSTPEDCIQSLINKFE
jgi:hypothetical protein